jgi:hypothetical protein
MTTILLKFIVFSTLILVGGGCTLHANAPSGKNIPLAEKRTIPNNKEDCLKIGGNWAQVGIPGGGFSCDLKANDFNKVCTDNSQCEGECLVEKSEKPGKKSIGLCSKYLSNYSCYKYLINGRVKDICVE